ncbi:hypothetical protein NLG97_g1026 [Lecanicillium saksenae]|uniref:Uncharacterized protein n=1 Tax=Lecanicillium saksenae TaxID=468837 RepID=A0ACC1R4W7_9HYPO|nr:hypothetical protein NLG97_g1026 [Lecanicillium saksenae]
MPEVITKFLKEELHRTTDVSKFVDCIWEVLSGDSRCWRELIRKIESTPDVAIPLSPVATPASIAEYDPDIRDVTVDPVTPATNTDQPIARPWSSARGYNEAAADTEAENIVQRKRCRSKNDITDSRTVKKRSPPLPPTATASKPRQLSTQASTVETSRRFRGPGRKQKPSAPDFNDERFNNILEQLRREIAEYTVANGLQDAWRVVDALRWPNPEAAKLNESISRIRNLQCQIQRCDISDPKDNSLPTLSTIQQRLYMVQLMAEYQKAVEEKHEGDKFGALKWFQKEIYPDKNSKQRQKSWDYFRRTAEPLFEAVRRYGYGVLIFPLRNVTRKSLHCLRRESISDVLDYIQVCHPKVETVLNNVSGLLAGLLTWGLPPMRLPISAVSYEDIMNSHDSHCTNLFMQPVIVNMDPPVVLGEIPPWPYMPVEDALVAVAHLQNDSELVGKCKADGGASTSTEELETTFDWEKAVDELIGKSKADGSMLISTEELEGMFDWGKAVDDGLLHEF